MKFVRFVFLAAFALVFWSCSDDSPVTPVTNPPGNGESIDTSVYRVPTDYDNIASAVNAAESGDTVLVSDGVYSGDSNRAIRFNQKRIVLISENGPTNTILDARGLTGASFLEFDILDSFAIVDGFTFRRGSSIEGGAINMRGATPTIRNCVFEYNSAMSGGAVRGKQSSPRFINCTFVHNSADVGAAFYFLSDNYPEFYRCIIALSSESEVIDGGDPLLDCCNVFGNEGGDFVAEFSSLDTLNDNFSQSPAFCDSLTDFSLKAASPCAPANNACGELIGALGVNCP